MGSAKGHPKRVTLRDVAEKAGVSVSTVSLALHNDPRLAARTRAFVQRAAAEIGYRPDLVGTLLRTSHPRVIGLIYQRGQELHDIYAQVIRERAAQEGYQVVTEPVSDPKMWREALNPAGVVDNATSDTVLQTPRPDGLKNIEFSGLEEPATIGSGPEDALTRIIQLRCQSMIVIDPKTLADIDPATIHIPVITIGQHAWNEGDLVVSDNHPGARALFAHLHSLGHRRVTYIAQPHGVSGKARQEAINAAASETHIDVTMRLGGSTLEDGYQAGLTMIEAARQVAAAHTAPSTGTTPITQAKADIGKDTQVKTAKAALGARGRYEHFVSDRALAYMPTAIVAYNDLCAHGVMVALFQAGIRVPEDISVAGFDNATTSASHAYDLTTVDRHVSDIVDMALGVAIQRRSGDGVSAQHMRADSRLVIRHSTGPVRTDIIEAN